MPPIAAAARKASASACIFMVVSSDLRGDFSGVERHSESLLFAIVPRAIPEPRPPNAGRAMPAYDLATGVLADHVVQENVLGDDGVAFHTHPLGNVGDAPGAVAQTSGLDDDVDRSADHLANGPRGQ